jgi:hypothetical protein
MMHAVRFYRKLGAMCLLMLALAVPTFAGWMPNGEAETVPPPPPEGTISREAPATGTTHTIKGEIQNPQGVISTTLTQVALGLLRNLRLLP